MELCLFMFDLKAECLIVKVAAEITLVYLIPGLRFTKLLWSSSSSLSFGKSQPSNKRVKTNLYCGASGIYIYTVNAAV